LRYFLVSFLIHVLVISFVWIGFSVPGAQQHSSLTYLSGAVPEMKGNAKEISGQLYDKGILLEESPAYFSSWLKMRQINKPKAGE
jgi:hypothetical protein